MKTFTFDGYKLSLTETDRRANTGQIKVKYTFKTPDGETLFSGDDFGCSPFFKPESKEAALSLLGFLTLRPGDTDWDFFKDYTPRQLEWSRSNDCENLQIYTCDV